MKECLNKCGEKTSSYKWFCSIECEVDYTEKMNQGTITMTTK